MNRLQQEPNTQPASTDSCPIDTAENETPKGQLNPEIRSIGKAQQRDVVSRLKASRFGRFYKNTLKDSPAVRRKIHAVWRRIYPIYVNARAFGDPESRWRRLIGLNEFVNAKRLSSVSMAPGALVKTPSPRVIPSHDQQILKAPHERYTFAPIQLITVNDAMIYGGTNFVFAKDDIIHHDLYDFDRDFTSEELHGRAIIDPRRKRIRWLLHDDDEPTRIPTAAVFVDGCAGNYAHWLTEVLPRIAVFCDQKRFKGIPIVVNEGLHDNIMESLFAVIESDRETITLPVGRAVRAEKLLVTSAAGYVPFERRHNRGTGHSHGVFSPPAIALMQEKISESVKKVEGQSSEKKIYVRRNSGVRKITNGDELEAYLVEHGYKVIEPEKLSFSQQVQCFQDASVVVGSSGAALANLLFTPKQARTYILIAKYSNTSYWYWQNIACASNREIRYVFGENSGADQGIHADFKIDLADVSQIIGENP